MPLRTNEGELAAWDIVSALLEADGSAERDLLPDIVESTLRDRRDGATPRIGAQPGAIDLGSISLQSATFYGVALTAVAAAVPKLFDATVDVAKDALKKRFDPTNKAGNARSDPGVGYAEVRARAIEAMRASGVGHERAERIADALVISLVKGSALDAR